MLFFVLVFMLLGDGDLDLLQLVVIDPVGLRVFAGLIA